MRQVRHSALVLTVSLFTLAASAPAAGQTGLVAAYGFNEGTGSTAIDASGNGGNGAISGATWSTEGRYGGSLSFNGSTSWVTVNDAARLDLTNAMTIEAWIKPLTSTGWQTVILKERTGGLSYALYSSDDAGRPSAWIGQPTHQDATSGSALPANVWVHVAATYNGSALRLYVNGSQVATRSVSGSMATSALPLRIGGNAVWDEYFSGLIDEVRVYNRALTQAEIQSDMTTPVGNIPTWSMSGTLAPGSLAGGALVTLTGTLSASTTASAGGSYSFSGLSNGTYSVTPSKNGVTFSPTSRSVTINGSNVSGIDFAASPGPTAIQLVQTGVNGFEPPVSSISASFPSSNTAGNFLIVTGTAARPAGTLTISDTAGNTYLPAIGPVTDGPQDVTAYIWYVPSAVGGPNTVTLTPTSARALEIHISEWSGVAKNSPLDQTAVASGFGTAASSGTRTTTMNGELIFGYTFIAHTATAGTGFTPLTLVNGDLDEYQIQTTAGAVAATFTQTAGDWFVLMATFKPAGVPDQTAPTVSMTAPPNGSSLFGITSISADASDNVAIAGVQFRLDGTNLGSEITTPPYTLAWDTRTTTDGPHSLTAVARDTSGNLTVSSAVNVNLVNTTHPTMVGQWSQRFELGLVAVDMILMHTGKVLMFSGSFATSAEERVWDPATGNLTLVPNPYYNLFCAGHAQLPDGRILLVGGFDPPSLGAANANIFDPVSETWSALPNMSYRRWYPTATTLPDGRMLISSGAQSCLTCLADVPEIYDPDTGQFSRLTGARLGVPYYPFVFVLPDGSVLNAGANEDATDTRRLDVANQTWTMVDAVVRDGHSAAMYRPGRILKSGTATDSGATGNATATAFVLDMTQPSPAWRQVASMANPRAFHNTTLLPDGNVLITGGGTTLDGYNLATAVRAAELWSPVSETWQTLATAGLPRLYHSTTLLLPDGRVLIAGGGNDGPAVNHTEGELYSPPYLFKGPRPTIASAPEVIEYGSTFTVATPDAASIASVSLIRPGSVTHAFDADQRFLPLTFVANAGALSIQAPANANLAPPGYYMLFLVNSAGVPSIAPFVRFPATPGDHQPPTPPTGLSAEGALGSAALTWNAASDNIGVALYNVHRSTTSGFQPSLGNRVGQVTTTSFTNTGLAGGVYYYVVTAQDVAGNVSGPSNEASVVVLSDTTAPTVAITAPTDQGTVAGSITISAVASDDVGVAGVQFQLDGTALGPERLSPPYSMTWNSATTSNGPHVLTAVARDAAGNQAVDTVDISVDNSSPTPQGLVAAYSFNAGSGVQVADSSGQGNTGTISSATWTTAGRFGSALSFNGSSAWVTVPDAPSLDLTTGMTIEAWVRPTAGSRWRTVIMKEGASSISYGLYSANGASRPAGWMENGGEFFVNGTSAVPLNTWTHLAVTHDGSVLRLFVNGVQVGSRTVPAMAPSTGPLRFGGNSNWLNEHYRGLIDEIRIYNRALTAAEIQSDMATPIP